MKISDFLSNYIGKDYPVFLTNLVPSPMVLLFKKAILVPNIKYTEIEIANILHHEATLLNQCDALIKRFIQILVILYWWFPLIYILKALAMIVLIFMNGKKYIFHNNLV